MTEEGAVVTVDLLKVGGCISDGCGSRIRPTVRPNKSASTPPAAPMAACMLQKAAGDMRS